jgi:hypothetical protein
MHARVKTLPMARNAQAILEARMGGMRPAEAVLVSMVGSLAWPNPTVYADSGVRYDWSWAEGMDRICLVVKTGVDASHAMRGLFNAMLPYYLAVADIEAKQLVFLTDMEGGRPHTMRFPDYEQEFFTWN